MPFNENAFKGYIVKKNVSMTDNLVCLGELAVLLGYTDKKHYIRRVSCDKVKVNGRLHVNVADCKKLLEKSRQKKAKKIYKMFHKDDNEGKTIVDAKFYRVSVYVVVYDLIC